MRGRTGFGSEHGAGDGEQSVGHGAEGLVFGLADGVVRDGDRRPMVQGAAQAVLCDRSFDTLPDDRRSRSITLKDCLLSALAVFHQKFPSLLQFDRTIDGRQARLNADSTEIT